MSGWLKCGKHLLRVSLIGMALIAVGCEGTDTRDQVDETVEELTGKKDVERYKKMQDDLGEIQDRQEEKYRQLDENADDK